MKIVARQLKLDIRHITAPLPRAFSHRIILSLQSRKGLFKNSEAGGPNPRIRPTAQPFKGGNGRDCTSVYIYSFINDAQNSLQQQFILQRGNTGSQRGNTSHRSGLYYLKLVLRDRSEWYINPCGVTVFNVRLERPRSKTCVSIFEGRRFNGRGGK